jgi:Lysozyme like domain
VADILTPDEVIALWLQAGGKLSSAPMALARAYSESSLNAAVTSPNPNGGTNVGLYQLDTTGVGSGYSVAQLQNPLTNTRITVRATQNGQNWAEWADEWQDFISRARQDVAHYHGGKGVTGEVKPGAPGQPISWDLFSDEGQGISDLFGALGNATGLTAVAEAIGVVAKDLEPVYNALTWLTLPSNWVRIIAGIFGAALLGAGVYLVGKEARA